MTIMLLPNNQMLVLGGEGMSMDVYDRMVRHLDSFLRGGQKVAALNGVSMVIDARVEPAIAINVPQP